MKPTYEELAKSLQEALNFIEHDKANEGKLTNADQWQRNVVEFRKHTSMIGVGRTALDEASVNLAKIRDQLSRINDPDEVEEAVAAEASPELVEVLKQNLRIEVVEGNFTDPNKRTIKLMIGMEKISEADFDVVQKREYEG